MTKEEYKQKKVYYLALPSAVALLIMQLVAFMSGLHVGWDDMDWIMGAALWFVLLAIQLIGNDLTWKDDEVFYVGWLFSYIVEVSAGTWTFYNIFILPNEYLRWAVSFGVSGIVAMLPERLILLWANNKKPKRDTVSTFKPKDSPKPSNSWMQSKQPTKKPDNATRRVDFPKITKEPTYRPLNIPSTDRTGKSLWDEGE